MDTHRHLILLMTAFGWLLAACSTDVTPEPARVEAAEVFVTPESLTVAAGATARLQAQANDSAGQAIGGAPLAFASATPTIVSVTAQGLVAAIGPVGNGVVQVTSGARQRSVTVRVVPGQAHALRLLGDVPATTAGTTTFELGLLCTDEFGNAVANARINVAVTPGADSLTPASVTTDAEGAARIRWQVGPEPGEYVLEASITGGPTLRAQTRLVAEEPAAPVT